MKTRIAQGLGLAAAVAALAGCATSPPARQPLARRAPISGYATPAPAAREAALADRNLVAEAGAFESFMRRARGIDPAFSGPGEVSQALQTGASHEPVQLESGMIAYAALAALQEPRFVAAVKADRSDLPRRLAADPRGAGHPRRRGGRRQGQRGALRPGLGAHRPGREGQAGRLFDSAPVLVDGQGRRSRRTPGPRQAALGGGLPAGPG